MERVIDFFGDLFKSLLISLICCTLSIIVIACAGFLSSERNWRTWLIWDQRVLLIIASLGLFIVAGLILKRSNSKRLVNEESWKKSFKLFNFTWVLLIVFLGFIFFAGMLDYLVH
jgi:sterol desaturase/sphingolipid hydroxylase (fatty acid hydroxylase superfamily)